MGTRDGDDFIIYHFTLCTYSQLKTFPLIKLKLINENQYSNQAVEFAKVENKLYGITIIKYHHKGWVFFLVVER